LFSSKVIGYNPYIVESLTTTKDKAIS